MLINMYVIHDKLSGVYNKPFYLQNDQVAQRSAKQLLSDPNSEISRSPEDYTLFKIGTFDDTSATIEMQKEPIAVVKFHELQAVLNNQPTDY